MTAVLRTAPWEPAGTSTLRRYTASLASAASVRKRDPEGRARSGPGRGLSTSGSRARPAADSMLFVHRCFPITPPARS